MSHWAKTILDYTEWVRSKTYIYCEVQICWILPKFLSQIFFLDARPPVPIHWLGPCTILCRKIQIYGIIQLVGCTYLYYPRIFRKTVQANCKIYSSAFSILKKNTYFYLHHFWVERILWTWSGWEKSKHKILMILQAKGLSKKCTFYRTLWTNIRHYAFSKKNFSGPKSRIYGVFFLLGIVRCLYRGLVKSYKTGKPIVLILAGNSEHVAHACGKKVFLEKKIRFVTGLDLIKFLKEIK